MRRIEIDDEVYGVLASRASGFETPNDVLRRVLDLSAHRAGPSSGTSATTLISGALAPLLEAGVIAAGDRLQHVQVRKGRAFSAVVEADGWLTVEGTRYRQPSPALGALVGTSIDGWAYWTHERSGKTLRQLRTEIGGVGRSTHG